MQDVFLSHSSADVATARRLAADLRAEGISVWVDESELPPGRSIAAIKPAIRSSRFVVVVVSNAALRSDWVQEEVDFAAGVSGITIVPFFIEEISQPLRGVLASLGMADARKSYRRALWRVITEVTGRENPLITAKEAVELVKTRTATSGELFGVSQQGVGTAYSLANRSDWRLCDAGEGIARVWVVEMFVARERTVEAFLVRDRTVEPFPVLHLIDSDPQPIAGSPIVLSCVINPDPPPLPAGELPKGTPIAKRYTTYHPVPVFRKFIDSDVAVASAEASPMARRLLAGRGDIFPMTKLQADVRHGNSVLWKVSFFDSSLTESVLTVGIDALTGRVTYPAMQGEIFNANFMHIGRDDDGTIRLSTANQYRAFQTREDDGRPSIRDALKEGGTALGDEFDRWQLAFISTTGVLESLGSGRVAGVDRLLRVDGTAGQWVLELCSRTATRVTNGSRVGYAYDLRRMIVTAEGVELVDETDQRQIVVSPLHDCPMPIPLAPAFDAAFALAFKSVAGDFDVLSVSHTRERAGLTWYFCFYGGEEIVEKMWVAGDGSRVVDVERGT